MSKVKILVVDDAPVICRTLETRLTIKGYKVIVTSDGVDAVLAAEREKPDLVILDINIPSINGYGTGDLLVHVNVWTPKVLTKEQREFFEKMKTDSHFIPKPEKEDKSFFEKVKDMFS